MAQSTTGRAIAIAIITVNAVISVLLIMAVVYLFFQVTHLQDENKNLRTKWQKLQATHQENDKLNEEEKPVEKKCCGIKGRRGRPGIKGDKGDPGLLGQPGMKGEKGDQGICNDSCEKKLAPNGVDFPLLHLHGNGDQMKRINNIDQAAVPFWNEAVKAGDIQYSKGKLTINVEGFYYIYSQMAYCGDKEPRVGHYMSINGTKVLQSIVTASANDSEVTHRVGGTFRLKKGDTITVSPFVTNVPYCFSREEAHFGAFFVRK